MRSDYRARDFQDDKEEQIVNAGSCAHLDGQRRGRRSITVDKGACKAVGRVY